MLFVSSNEKFSLRSVSSKICGHPGGNLLQSGLEVGEWVILESKLRGWNRRCDALIKFKFKLKI